MSMSQQDIYEVQQTLGGGYKVIGPDGHAYHFDSFSASRKFMDMSMNKYSNYNDVPTKEAAYPDEAYEQEPENAGDYYDEANKARYSTNDLDKLKKQLEKQHATIKQLAEMTTPAGVKKIQAEMDRIQAQIDKSTDEDSKAKMGTYLAGLNKALKLIQE